MRLGSSIVLFRKRSSSHGLTSSLLAGQPGHATCRQMNYPTTRNRAYTATSSLRESVAQHRIERRRAQGIAQTPPQARQAPNGDRQTVTQTTMAPVARNKRRLRRPHPPRTPPRPRIQTGRCSCLPCPRKYTQRIKCNGTAVCNFRQPCQPPIAGGGPSRCPANTSTACTATSTRPNTTTKRAKPAHGPKIRAIPKQEKVAATMMMMLARCARRGLSGRGSVGRAGAGRRGTWRSGTITAK